MSKQMSELELIEALRDQIKVLREELQEIVSFTEEEGCALREQELESIRKVLSETRIKLK